MTSLPYFNLFVTDEAADTAHLTAEEHGAYHRLRCAYWRHDGLPEDDERLRRITGIEADRWPAVRLVVASLFEDGWRLPKLDDLRERSEATHAKLVEAGKRGGRPRKDEKGGIKPRESQAIREAESQAFSTEKGGHKPGLSNQHQMKNTGVEGLVPTRTRAPARGDIPRLKDRLAAGQWLTTNADLFPGDPGFDSKIDMMIGGMLTWDDLRGAG